MHFNLLFCFYVLFFCSLIIPETQIYTTSNRLFIIITSIIFLELFSYLSLKSAAAYTFSIAHTPRHEDKMSIRYSNTHYNKHMSSHTCGTKEGRDIFFSIRYICKIFVSSHFLIRIYK